MATYVFSDVHGHSKTLQRLLEQVSPADEDEIWILGDMIDRGPDPVEVIKICRNLPNSHVLMGNHEELMLDCLRPRPGTENDGMAPINWAINGGGTTYSGLEKLPEDEYEDIIDWVASLPLGAHIRIGDRPYLLVHAGLRALTFGPRKVWSDAALDNLLKYQNAEDVLWMREEFWGKPTGLLDADGNGPIVIAGHTPVPYVEPIGDVYDRPARNEDGQCQMMHLGATEATGGVADRWAIDCGAAGGAGWGRILMLRLDDGKEFYAAVEEGE